MPFEIIRNDITKVKADAIVNTANPNPTFGAGTDAAIYKAAGEEELLAERKKIGTILPGDVAVTPAFNLMSKYIIHTVGPAWVDGNEGEFDTLRSCYSKSLNKAEELGCESIAFPLIATGVYGFPKSEAFRIAIDEISSFLMESEADIRVFLVVFDDQAFRLSKNLFFQVQSFITDKKVIKAHCEEYGVSEDELDKYGGVSNRRRRIEPGISNPGMNYGSAISAKKTSGKSSFDSHTFDKELYKAGDKGGNPFLAHLMKLLNEKGMDNTTVYKSSNVDRKTFSKILCGDTKIPQKKTILGLCIGLRLTLDEAKELLASADMAFNPHDRRDDLVQDCLIHHQYNIFEVNSMLYLCGFGEIGNIVSDPEMDKKNGEKGQK